MEKYILDMTCSGRSIWFDKKNPYTIYFDKRDIEYSQVFNGNEQKIVVHPDVVGNYEKLPFDDNTFNLVVFDPPHLIRESDTGWIQKKYGHFTTKEEALESVSKGIQEGIRVLKDKGVLIFKWNEVSIPVSEIIKHLDYTPLFGHHSGKKNETHWMCFMKDTQNKKG